MSLRERWQAVMMDNYGTPAVTITAGHGARVVDDAGVEYIDLVAGIAVNSLGHAHPDLIAALSKQTQKLGHTSNLAIHETGVQLAERLVALADPARTRGGRVFFCNSGAEANEAAFKLSRLTGRTKIVAATGGFHGRTMGSLALTGQPEKQRPFEPLPGDVHFVAFGDVTELTAAVDDDTAAIFIECIQGEGGVIPADGDYLREVQHVARAHGALLVVDEVQTGIGRTGNWFAFQHDDLQPDIVTLAKGLAGGVPIGAVVAFGTAATLFTPGSHGSTFGGNPYSTSAALAVLDVIERDGLIERAQIAGQRLATGVSAIDGVRDVRGRGLMLAAVLAAPIAKDIELAARERGVLINAIGTHALRMVPPLVISDADIDAAIERLADAFVSVTQ